MRTILGGVTMNERNIKLTPKNIALYVLGFLIIGLGVIIMERSNLGVGAWDATNFNLNIMLNKLLSLNFTITKGTTSLILSFILFIVVAIYKLRKGINVKIVISILLLLIPMFTIAFVIDFWDLLVFSNFYPESIYIRIVLFILGLVIIPFGLVLIIASNFPATVYDEFTIMLTEVLKVKNFGKVRLGFEITGVVLATIFTLIAKEGLGYVSVGTLIMAVSIGPLMNVYLKMFGMTKEKPKNG